MISVSRNFLTNDCVGICAGMEPIPLSLLAYPQKKIQMRITVIIDQPYFSTR